MEAIITKLQFETTDIATKVEQRASTTEVLILKQSLSDMTETIERLCKLLEDVEDPAQEKPAAPSQSIKKVSQNVKLLIFRLDQRVSELEKRIVEIQAMSSGELLEEAKQETQLIQVRESIPSERRSTPSPGAGKPPEPGTSNTGTGFKGILSRHEMIINDLNLRISELEGGMQKIEPNSIRTLIKDIAEIVMQEEKKEVTAAMDDIKGHQKHHAQLVETLRENLKVMDEKFTQDIDKKIEKKDLYTTKNQLRRKVNFSLEKSQKKAARS